MTTILVCPLSRVGKTIASRAPECIVSLLDPDFTFPEAGPAYVGRHLCLRFHDTHVPTARHVMPAAEHIEELLVFVSRWQRTAPILMHCRAGVGRSTAAAFISACFLNPHADELQIAAALRQASPLARPNEALIRLADAALNRNGRMNQAITETGRGLSWVEVEAKLSSTGEAEAFEMPATFAAEAGRPQADEVDSDAGSLRIENICRS
jgi:predicted protein tyrosine phosphatase